LGRLFYLTITNDRAPEFAFVVIPLPMHVIPPNNARSKIYLDNKITADIKGYEDS
jgi:hypothetical protein